MVLPSPRLTKTGVQPEGAPQERCQLRGEAAVEDHSPSDNRAFKSHPVQKETLATQNWGSFGDVSGGSVVKNLPANAGEVGSIPGLGTAHMLQSNLACGPESLWGLCSETRGATEMRSSHTKTRSYLPLVTTRETPNSKGDPSAA